MPKDNKGIDWSSYHEGIEQYFKIWDSNKIIISIIDEFHSNGIPIQTFKRLSNGKLRKVKITKLEMKEVD